MGGESVRVERIGTAGENIQPGGRAFGSDVSVISDDSDFERDPVVKEAVVRDAIARDTIREPSKRRRVLSSCDNFLG